MEKSNREHAPVMPTGQPIRYDVVSVQSQVVYGRVGNNVAVPVLESMGLSVAAVPTVVLSNTPHYPTLHGGAIPVEWFRGYLQDLSARDALGALRVVVTGYLGSADQAQALAEWVRPLLDAPHGPKLVIDPVLGDHGDGVYVESALVGACRDLLVPLAHGLTPNDFELSQLTRVEVNDVADAVAAARTLLGARTQWVAVTSAAPRTWRTGRMQVVVVTRDQAWAITHPRIEVTPRGTGDLFNATLAAHWSSGVFLPEAAVMACNRVLQAMRCTRRLGAAELQLPGNVDDALDEDITIRQLHGL